LSRESISRAAQDDLVLKVARHTGLMCSRKASKVSRSSRRNIALLDNSGIDSGRERSPPSRRCCRRPQYYEATICSPDQSLRGKRTGRRRLQTERWPHLIVPAVAQIVKAQHRRDADVEEMGRGTRERDRLCDRVWWRGEVHDIISPHEPARGADAMIEIAGIVS